MRSGLSKISLVYMVDKDRAEVYLTGVENTFYYPYRAMWRKKSVGNNRTISHRDSFAHSRN